GRRGRRRRDAGSTAVDASHEPGRCRIHARAAAALPDRVPDRPRGPRAHERGHRGRRGPVGGHRPGVAHGPPMTQVLLAFVGATLVIVLSPGPDTLLVLRNAAAGGRRAAAWTTAGILAGNLAWQAAVVAGLAALVRSSETAYDVLRYLGAAYLVYLGVRS